MEHIYDVSGVVLRNGYRLVWTDDGTHADKSYQVAAFEPPSDLYTHGVCATCSLTTFTVRNTKLP